MAGYDPFERGPRPVGVTTVHALDAARGWVFPCEIWYPAAARHRGQDTEPATQDAFMPPGDDAPRRQAAVRDAEAAAGRHPLVVFSHHSGGHRRTATYLCTHLASHGYLVAALDHAEVVAEPLAARAGRTVEERVAAWIANRVPDVRFLLDHLLERSVAALDATRIGIVGHSFGGWTALAAPDVERRIGAVVALAPGGSANPRPGIIPATLAFDWGRDVPTLYLTGECDVAIPPAAVTELYDRTPATRRMIILRKADHLHFVDDVERAHEAVRAMSLPGEAAWLPAAMRPIEQLCPGEQAHRYIRGLALCHLDATLRGHEPARSLLAGDIEARLAARCIEAIGGF